MAPQTATTSTEEGEQTQEEIHALEMLRDTLKR